MSRRAGRTRASLAAVAVLLGAGACVGRRERLDVPGITLDVTSPAAVAGGHVDGRVSASDASGLVSLAVYACTADSVFRTGDAYDRAHEASLDFSLRVASDAAAGDPVEIYAAAFDDQGFVAEASRVVYVGGVAGRSGAGLCTRLRRSASAALPTAPGP